MGGAAQSGLNIRLVVPLMAHGIAVQMLTGLLRVSTSYHVIELELPVFWLGAISATFALLPVFLAVVVGRFIDRGHDALCARIGSSFVAVSAVGLCFFSPTAVMILCFTALLGVGHLCLMASHQMLCVRATGEGSRDAMFGNFLIATGLGQALGPFVVGLVGGAAKVPETHPLFLVGLVMAFGALLISFAIPKAKGVARDAKEIAPIPVRELFRIPGFTISLVASVMTMTSQEITVIYLPLLGAEHSIDVSDIGLILMTRSGASVLARLFYARLVSIVGRVQLTLLSMTLAGLSYAALGFPLTTFMMYVVAGFMGMGLGIATTLSLTNVLELAPYTARATALSLRITGNRIGQVSLPFMASFLAAATGARGVFAVIGVSLIGSALSVGFVRRKR